MKISPIYAGIVSLLLSQIVNAETKNLDFYPSGSNRYSISGTVGELGLSVNKNSVLIESANSDSYLRLNNQAPYHLTFIESDLNLYQVIEFNKGKLINYKDRQIKLISAQGDKVVAEDENKIVFIPLSEISIPKSFLNDTQKGLKATFVKNIEPNDKIYFSQFERQLNYRNTYESIIKGDNIQIVHYLNINNSSQKTFDNVFLTFFLSETNIQENRDYAPVFASPKALSARMEVAAMAPPVFENNSLQGLKNISIKEPLTIYPNFNKIKYSEKNYKMSQFVKLSIDDKYDIYLGDEVQNNISLKDIKTPGNPVNVIFMKELESLKETIKNSVIFENKIDISLNNDDILPPGKLDIYESEKNQDKLVVSTNINHTENKNLEVLKSKNNDLKVLDINLEVNDNISLKSKDNKRIGLNLKDIEIKNNSNESYTIYLFGKKTKINSNSTVKLVIN